MEEARGWIGRERPPRTFEVTAQAILRFAVATGDRNPRHRAGEVAPPLFYTALANDEEDLEDLEPSGIGRQMTFTMQVPVPGFPGAVAGGREVRFGPPIRPGDRITRRERIANVSEKEGRRGPMVFVVGEREFWNQRGELVVQERSTLIRTR